VAARNLVVVILDSLRYDSWLAAEPTTLAQLGPVERRWSYATWTAPSHYNLLMGLLPHTSPPEVYASEYYKQDFLRYGERLGVPDMEFKRLLPSIFLPTYLRRSLGYLTHARVSMPVLNPFTVINRDFDSFKLMPSHNDMAAMLDKMSFDADRPSFYLLNVGETHYPYALPHEPADRWPRLSGVHGTFRHLDDLATDAAPAAEPAAFFDGAELGELRERLEREKIGTVKLILGRPGDPMLPRSSIDVAILSHVYHEIENPFELLYRLQPALAPGARVGIVDVDRPTQDHGTPPALLRCEAAAAGYRQVEFVSLAPAEGYLAIFVPPDRLPAVEAIKPCRQG